jgi:hypothetical protein
MALTEFNHENLKILRNILELSFKQFEEKTGVKMAIGGMSFTQKSFTTKLTGIIPSGEAEEELSVSNLKRKMALEQNGYRFGVNDSYGKIKVLKGIRYRLIGLSTASKKYPIVVQDIRGNKQIRMTVKFWNSVTE